MEMYLIKENHGKAVVVVAGMVVAVDTAVVAMVEEVVVDKDTEVNTADNRIMDLLEVDIKVKVEDTGEDMGVVEVEDIKVHLKITEVEVLMEVMKVKDKDTEGQLKEVGIKVQEEEIMVDKEDMKKVDIII